ncbi:MAG TPA: class I SAM-dependent methyltransferase, partial [Candidatus Caenarcaniphilales bacterium]
RGVYLYAMGRLGPLNDDLGQSLIQNYLQQSHADFKPVRILDLGCSVGHSTLPYVDAYPEAEVYGLDIAAPMLRYAHARAESLHKRVHFCQQNAEHTNFETGSFDLIVSHILLHEVPSPAIRNIVRECYRLLAPGGMMLHLDAPQYDTMDPYSACMFDWETANNNEPFWSAMREMDLVALASRVGFEARNIIHTFVASGAWMKAHRNTSSKGGFGSRGNWFVFGARK